MTTTSDTPLLAHEWATLQNNHEQYEKSATLVKLTAAALACLGMALWPQEWMVAALVVLLWGQECILRTSQARLGERLMQIESALRGVASLQSALPCQLYTQWLAQRQGTGGLLAEYAAHAKRPTVAFPYAPLLLIQAALQFT